MYRYVSFQNNNSGKSVALFKTYYLLSQQSWEDEGETQRQHPQHPTTTPPNHDRESAMREKVCVSDRTVLRSSTLFTSRDSRDVTGLANETRFNDETCLVPMYMYVHVTCTRGSFAAEHTRWISR